MIGRRTIFTMPFLTCLVLAAAPAIAFGRADTGADNSRRGGEHRGGPVREAAPGARPAQQERADGEHVPTVVEPSSAAPVAPVEPVLPLELKGVRG